MPGKNKKLNNKLINYVLSMSRKLIRTKKACHKRDLYLTVLP